MMTFMNFGFRQFTLNGNKHPISRSEKLTTFVPCDRQTWRHYKFCCRRYVASGCICESNELIGARPRVVIGSFCLLLLSEEAGRCSGWTMSMSDANIHQQHEQHHHQDQSQHQQESGVLDGHQSHTLGNERSQLISSKAQLSQGPEKHKRTHS